MLMYPATSYSLMPLLMVSLILGFGYLLFSLVMISDAAAGQNHTIVHFEVLFVYWDLKTNKQQQTQTNKKTLINITSKQVYTFFSSFYLNRILKVLRSNCPWHKYIWSLQAHLQLDAILNIIMFNMKSCQLLLSVTVYEVHVTTGDLWNAGTEADVYISIYGEKGDTGSRQLVRSQKPKKFLKGQVSTRAFSDVFVQFFPLQWAVMLQLWEIITAFLCYFRIPQLSQDYFLIVHQWFWKMSRILIYKIDKLCSFILNI